MEPRKGGSEQRSGRSRLAAKGAPVVEFTPQFLGVLSKLVHGATSEQASDKLLSRVFGRLDKASGHPCISGPVQALAEREKDLEPWRAEARTRMELLRAVADIASARDDEIGPDPLVAAAEREHENVEQGPHTPLTAEAAGKLPFGLPAFRSGRLEPGRTGRVKVGETEGVFVEYTACREDCKASMLMVFDTRQDPSARVLEFHQRRYWAARHAAHTFLAWRGDKDAWLHVLVTHCPFRNSLALAELMRG